MPVRVQLSRQKGFHLPPNTIVVARPSKWGNPFRVGDPHPKTGKPMTPQDAVFLFEGALTHEKVQEIRLQLLGSDLACWCGPGGPCHADVLLKVANP